MTSHNTEAPQPSVLFEKMHGLGNDFMLVDTRHQRLSLSAGQIQKWADRRTGIGFDQLIVLSPSKTPGYLAEYRFFNADGSAAEQCGNGQRCLGRYLWQSGWAKTRRFQVTGSGGPVTITVHAPADVEISLPAASCRLLQSNDMPLDAAQDRTCAEVNVGNPHRVHWVQAVEAVDLASLAQRVRAAYADGINVEVVEVCAPDHLKIRIDERGSGETRACGSGAAAAAVASQIRAGSDPAWGRITSPLRVEMPGGSLLVNYQPATGALSLRGPASHVFQGRAFYQPE
jgi:diaminopimelate epimerase